MLAQLDSHRELHGIYLQGEMAFQMRREQIDIPHLVVRQQCAILFFCRLQSKKRNVFLMQLRRYMQHGVRFTRTRHTGKEGMPRQILKGDIHGIAVRIFT